MYLLVNLFETKLVFHCNRPVQKCKPKCLRRSTLLSQFCWPQHIHRSKTFTQWLSMPLISSQHFITMDNTHLKYGLKCLVFLLLCMHYIMHNTYIAHIVAAIPLRTIPGMIKPPLCVPSEDVFLVHWGSFFLHYKYKAFWMRMFGWLNIDMIYEY